MYSCNEQLWIIEKVLILFQLKKRASLSNNNNNPTYKTNNSHIEELSITKLDYISFTNDGIKDSSKLIRNEFLRGKKFK